MRYFEITIDDKIDDDFLEMNMLVVSCKINQNEIGSSFQVRFYQFTLEEDSTPYFRPLEFASISSGVKNVEIKKSKFEENTIQVILLSKDSLYSDSLLFLIFMEYTPDGYFEISRYNTFTGAMIGLDKFIVNAFMFIPHDHYFIVAIDDFGLAVIDTRRIEIAQLVYFRSLFEDFYETFGIVSLIPISSNEIRVLLKNREGFTLFWDKIELSPIDGRILTNLRADDRFVNFPSQIATDLVEYSSDSIVQII